MGLAYQLQLINFCYSLAEKVSSECLSIRGYQQTVRINTSLWIDGAYQQLVDSRQGLQGIVCSDPVKLVYRFPRIIFVKRKVTPPDEELRTIPPSPLSLTTRTKYCVCLLLTAWFLKGVLAGACDLRLLTHRFPKYYQPSITDTRHEQLVDKKLVLSTVVL